MLINENVFFGKPFDDKCPVCDEKVVAICKCMIADRQCAKGHQWHRDITTGQAILGSGHNK